MPILLGCMYVLELWMSEFSYQFSYRHGKTRVSKHGQQKGALVGKRRVNCVLLQRLGGPHHAVISRRSVKAELPPAPVSQLQARRLWFAFLPQILARVKFTRREQFLPSHGRHGCLPAVQ